VVAPDQVDWGKSPKPDIHYSFQLLAANTAALLDHLGVGNVAERRSRPARHRTADIGAA
jgi:pimeloyl-ACP methyl ester carboxylesterase